MASLFIQMDKPFYIAGDTVNGLIFLNLFQNINANEVLVKFKGWESVKWFEERILTEEQKASINPSLIYQNIYRMRMDSSDSQDHPGQDDCARFKFVKDGYMVKEIIRYAGGRNIARFDQVVYNFGGNFIPAGQYSFPFSFKTGQNYPASFIDKSPQNNRRGRIKYEMQAFVRGFNNRLILLRTKQELIVREMAPIKNDQQEMHAHVTSCCCIDQGITRIQCCFQKNGYTPGEDARIICRLNNSQGKSQVISVNVTLLNQITYTSTEGHKKVFNSSIFKQTFPGLPAGGSDQRFNTVKIVNTMGGGMNQADIKPTARGNRLHSVYYLVVEADLAASCTCCSDLPIVRQPVLIYPFIPVNYVFNAPPNWNPKIMPSVALVMNLGSLGVIPPQINMNVSFPSANMNFSGPNYQIPNMNVQMKSPTVEMGMKNPPTVQMQGNLGVNPYAQKNISINSTGMNIDLSNNSTNGGISINMNSPTRPQGVVGVKLRAF